MSNDLVKHAGTSGKAVSVYGSIDSFENAQRIAKALASSTLVPENYRNNVSNTMLALEMANRVGVSPFMVMQNMNVISGRPSWGSSFIIAAINGCGKFAPLKFRVEQLGQKKITGPAGEQSFKDLSCVAYTTDADGNTIEGPEVTISMAVAEGWYDRKGSKWRTMPELMLRYRAAAFFGRLYCPEIMMGMHTADEVEDIAPAPDRLRKINQATGQRNVEDASYVDVTNPIDELNNLPDDAGGETADNAASVELEDSEDLI